MNNVKSIALAVFFISIFVGVSIAHASQTNGTIDSVYKYAWSNVAGYVNFAPTNGGLTITDSAITGYAWGANTGWINFDTTQSGVTNDGNGTLGGFAWDEGGGWVSFTGVTIDSDGKFHGMATGGMVNGASYAINFDCTSCDVRTDWRTESSMTTPTPNIINGSISPIAITSIDTSPTSTSIIITPVITPTTDSYPSEKSTHAVSNSSSSISIQNNNYTNVSTSTINNTGINTNISSATTTDLKLEIYKMIIYYITSGALILILITLLLFFRKKN